MPPQCTLTHAVHFSVLIFHRFDLCCRLPESFGELSELKALWLVNNELSSLPHSLGKLQQLEQLEVSGNALQELPRSFGRLGALRQLWMRDNAFSVLPPQICALERLETLSLEQNQISVLPRSLAHMPALRQILLGGNLLEYPPAGLIREGSNALLDFLRGYKQSDLRTAESDAAAREVATSRERLSLSLNQKFADAADDQDTTDAHEAVPTPSASEILSLTVGVTAEGGAEPGAVLAPTASPRRTEDAASKSSTEGLNSLPAPQLSHDVESLSGARRNTLDVDTSLVFDQDVSTGLEQLEVHVADVRRPHDARSTSSLSSQATTPAQSPYPKGSGSRSQKRNQSFFDA